MKQKFWRNRVLSAMGAVLLIGLLIMTGCTKEEDFTSRPKYLKSATYFSDEWALNFWNAELSDMGEELAQIAEDGFNSIILVVPWREFQPTMEPISYNEYALEQLDRVMEAAKAQGLWVSLRVGYTWDYWNDGTDVRERFRNVMGDETVAAAWDDYVKTIYERANAHGNLCGGFLTWEDFWSFTYYATEQGRGEDSIYWADFSGYTDYVKAHYTLDQVSQLYGEEITDFSKLYLPEKQQPALKLLYEFFDVWLNEFLVHNQEIFPDLSMEARMDMDLVYNEQGEQVWYGHEVTYPCGNSSYVSLMYGVPMGHINQGERLEAAEALVTSQQMLDHVLQYTEGKKLYIEQFLYMDNTPGFEHNAQVKEDQVDDYIVAMADILRDRIMGYGVWTYRNYADNLLYNPQFALGDVDWQLNGGAEVVQYNGSNQVSLPVGSSLHKAVTRGTSATYVRFTADGEVPVTVTVSLGDHVQEVTLTSEQLGSGKAIELFFENGGDGLTFTADGPCYIDNVKVYTRTQEGQLYTMDGDEGTCIQAIRTLNKKLR